MNVPQLRFTNFKKSWNSGNLGGITIKIQDGNYGGLYPKPEEFVFEGVPFLTSKVIGTTGNFNFNKVDYITKEKNNELKKAQIISKDIIFTNRGASFGTTGIVPEYIKFGNIGPQLTLIRSNSSLVKSDYLFHYLNTAYSRNHVRKLDSGSAMNFIGLENTKKIPIKFPSLPEQEKIASFFTVIDLKLNLLKEKKEKLELYKKGVMQQIFSQKLRFKDEKGNEFPEWEKYNFKDLYEFKTTNSFSREKLNYESGNVYNIHYGDIHTKFTAIFKFKNEFVPFINSDVDVHRIAEENYVREGDLIIADASEDYNDIGKAIEILDLDNQKVLAGLHTLLARKKTKLNHNGFMSYLLKSIEYRKQIHKIAQGSKVLSLSTTRVSDLEFYLPSVPEQQKIADFLSALDTKINLVSIQIEKTELWKKGLLQQMFV